MRTPPVSRKLTSALVAATMAGLGLVVTTVLAPVAAAAAAPTGVSPITAPTASTYMTDALPTVQIDGVVWDQTIVGNTVYVGGQFANARPAGAAPGTNLTTRNNLLAYDIRTGNLITSFAPNLNAQVKTVAASPDGTRIYVGGTFTTANGANRYRIAAYNTATGALITTFAPSVNTTVNAIVATNTTVYVGGTFTSTNGVARTRLSAFNAANGANTGWAPTADGVVQALTIASDGNIVVGGAFLNVNGSPAYGLAKLDATNGALLPWNTTNLIRNAGANAAILSLSSVGDVVYGTGYTFGSGGNLEGTFAADAVTGNIKWVEDCHGDTYDHFATATTVYTVSHAHYCGNLGGFPQSDPWSVNMKHALAFTTEATGTLTADPLGYYNYAGTPSPSMVNWFPDVAAGTYTGKGQAAWSITGNSDYLVLGGEFPKVDGMAQQGLVRFAIPSIAPNKMGPEYTGTAFSAAIVGMPTGATRIAWQANSDPDDLTLTYKVTRNGTVVYTTTADSTFWNRPTMGFIDTTATPGVTYTYRVSATDSKGNVAQSPNASFTTPAAGSASAYAQRVVADGAAPYWPLSESSGTTLVDNSGFNDATATAGLVRGTAGAVAGNAATTFDGSTSTATRTAMAATNTFTAQAWINTTTTAGGKILGFGSSATGLSGSYDRHIYMDNAGHIVFGVYPGFTATVASSGTYNDGTWHQITATLGADGMKLYVDSKLVGSRTDVTTGQVYQGFWRVGGDNINGWPGQPSSNYIGGAIDEVAIYPTVLTRQQVDAQWVASGRASTLPAVPTDAYGSTVFTDNPLLFWRLGDAVGATTAKDSGPNGDQTGLIQNGLTLGVAGGIKGTGDTAASFDGSDDLVASTNSFTNPKNYTEEAWFKTTTTNGGKIIGFGSSQTGTSGGYDRHVYMSNDGKVTFGTWTGFMNTITTATALNDGVWHHVVASQSTTDGMKLYIDGALVGANPQTDAQDYSGYWRVGGDNQWSCCSPFINATIDDVAVYNSVLTPAQVARHFNLGNTVAAPNRAPVAAFSSTTANLVASFDGGASSDAEGPVSYDWDFGDNSARSTAATPQHTYAAAGTYTVTLTVTDTAGKRAVVTHPVTVAPAPNVAPTVTFTAATLDLGVTVDATGSTDSDGTITGYRWDFGDGGTATGLTASHTYSAAGNYVITLTATDNANATAQTTNTVTVTSPAPVNVAPTARFVVSPADLTVTVDGSTSTDQDGSVVGYSWNFGDGTAVGSGRTTTHTYAAAGTYTISLTVQDDKQASNTVSQPIQVSAPRANVAPTADFLKTVNGLTANVSSTSSDSDGTITAYAWTFGDGGTADTATATHTYAAAGSYQIQLTVTDNGNVSTASTIQTVAVTGPPPANVAPVAGFTATTNGLTAALDGTSSTDSDGTVAAYAWDFGDGVTGNGTTATTSHTYLVAGTFQVALTVTDNSGATTTVTKPVTVSKPVPVAVISDQFSRTTTNSWGSADVGGAWTTVGGAANSSVNGGTGKIRMSAAGAAPGVQLGGVAAADVDATIEVALDKAATGGGTYESIAVRQVGNSDYRAKVWFKADGTVQVSLVKTLNGVSTALRSVNLTGLTYTAGAKLTVRLQAQGDTSVALRAKVWLTGATEPAGWQATATDASSPLGTGGIALYSYLSGSSTQGAVLSSFDNLSVMPIA